MIMNLPHGFSLLFSLYFIHCWHSQLLLVLQLLEFQKIMKRNDQLINLSMDQSIEYPFWLESPKKIYSIQRTIKQYLVLVVCISSNRCQLPGRYRTRCQVGPYVYSTSRTLQGLGTVAAASDRRSYLVGPCRLVGPTTLCVPSAYSSTRCLMLAEPVLVLLDSALYGVDFFGRF